MIANKTKTASLWVTLLILLSVPCYAENRPNVILIITDDQCWDSLGFMGGKVHTPRIDQMARDGLFLTNFHVTSTVCSPSRYSFLTGRYAGRCEGDAFLKEHPPGDQTQVENIGELEDQRSNLAKLLQRSGYRTGFVGKSHIVRHDWIKGRGAELESYPRDADPRVPEINAKMQRNHDRWCKAMRAQGFDFASGVYGANLKELENDSLNVHNLDWTIAKAFEFLEPSGKEPFFLCFSTTLHHGPAPWNNKFSLDADPRMTGEGFVKEGFDVLPGRDDVLKRNRLAGFKDRDAYALWLDDGVGAILDRVKSLALEEDTLIMFVPDHGSYRHGKATLHDYGMKVPMLLQWTGKIAPGARHDGLLANIDVAPTILDVCGVNVPDGYVMDGRSFKHVLFGGNESVREFIFGELGHSRAIKTKEWKYIAVRYPPELQREIDSGKEFRSFDGGSLALPYLTRNIHLGHYASKENPHYFKANQLYRLSTDPEETNNVYDGYPGVAREMQSRLSDALRKFKNRPFGEFTVPKPEEVN